NRTLKAGKWDKKKFEGRELAGKTLGVIGLGNIGRIVADRARGLRMNVIGFDPLMTADRASALGIELCPLDAIWERADAITVHTPLTGETRGLVHAGMLARLKKGVLLVNAARGGIYDEAALLEGLGSGQIGGVALDVFVEEPPPKDHPLLAHERVVVTPTSAPPPARRRTGWPSRSPSRSPPTWRRAPSRTPSTCPPSPGRW